eukprot:CAMPEP_0116011052 /NCGR_PEP_ID=MMETSP0321-20121206/4350_1 /TAXON_ID=163516 /ORGANISM="Leptocylindrus danicus var. danicus, Strain B650" /LENGTH=390 /DNA_ID=CAMNT_0003480235 /DNA_START=643 /DNA_END=1815 /DNA_ORIENTATION=+
MDTNNNQKARIALVGAGWWAQGWHLPHLKENPSAEIVAIVDSSRQPTSALDPNLESLDILAERYNCKVYTSLDHMLNEFHETGDELNGIIVSAPHATHFELGRKILEFQHIPKINILMEKPFTTCIQEARLLHGAVQKLGRDRAFMVNHSANFRKQAILAKSLVDSGALGSIRHVTAFMGSPLIWIFDNPKNSAWNEPSGSMLGNGFAWGQSSHILAFLYLVTGLQPSRVFCTMNHSEKTGADIAHAASIMCECGATVSLSGTTLLPGDAHADPVVGKLIRLKIFGSKGALIYSGDGRKVESGSLQFRREDGSVEEIAPEDGFKFENIDQEGNGPESLQAFIDACLGKEFFQGADCAIGLKTVQTIDAMYRSQKSMNAEPVIFGSEEEAL